MDEQKKNIIFDLDGTVLDSRRRHSIVLADCINKIHLTNYTCSDFCDFVEYKSNGNNTAQYLACKRIENIQVIFDLWKKQIEYRKYLKTDVLYPDICDNLEALSTKYNLILVTARSNRKNTLWQLLKLDIEKYFNKIFIVKNNGNVGFNKFEALKSIQIDYVIGDTETDYELATLAKCKFFALSNGFRSKEFLKKNIDDTYGDVNEIIKNELQYGNPAKYIRDVEYDKIF